jgi:hypothetical protein
MSPPRDSFHNPYHFVPARRRERAQRPVGEVDLEAAGAPQAAFDLHPRWQPDRFSGRLVCRLETVTPLVIGAQRHVAQGTDPAVAEPFELDPGEPALPASSLRGMISAVAEAASESALRVLGDKQLSFRKVMRRDEDKGGPLSALGMVWDVPGESRATAGYTLKPLTVPTLEEKSGKVRLPDHYERMFPVPVLRVYVGDFLKGRDDPFHTTTAEDVEAGRLPRLRLRSGMPAAWVRDERGSYLEKAGPFRFKGRYLVSADRAPGAEPNVEGDGTQGVLRVLGRWKPGLAQRKHEIFIPLMRPFDEIEPFPIEPLAVQRFHDLADERHASGEGEAGPLPYEPEGTARSVETTTASASRGATWSSFAPRGAANAWPRLRCRRCGEVASKQRVTPRPLTSSSKA